MGQRVSKSTQIYSTVKLLDIFSGKLLAKFCGLPLALFILLFEPNLSANVVGPGAQNFNTTTSGLDFVTVQSSETLRPWIINSGLFFNFAVNSLPYFDDSSQGHTKFNDTLLGADFNVGMGLFKNFDFGVSFPFVLAQTVSSSGSSYGLFSKKGSTEVRVNTKYRFMGTDDGGMAAIFSVNFNTLQNNPYTGLGAGPTTNYEIAWDKRIGRFTLGANLGYRWAQTGTRVADAFFAPIGSQWIASVASNFLIPETDAKIIAEIFGSTAVKRNDSNYNRSTTSAELLVGVKYDLTTQLAFHAGGGTELIHAMASPDWRVYTGLNYSFGPVVDPGARFEVNRHKRGERLTVHSIQFEFDSALMVGNFERSLKEIVDYIKSIGRFEKIIVEGHTDSIGPAAYNQKLSELRAATVREYVLELLYVKSGKVVSIGKGEAEPIADNGNFQGRWQNRRVEIYIER